MSRPPSLDDLIGTEDAGEDRGRLQHVHELLLQAGPPEELSPELEAGPTLEMTLRRPRRARRARAMMLVAAALVVVLIFVGGYAVGNGGGKPSTPAKTVLLKGTAAAPGAEASLEVWRPTNGNWPMVLNVTGLHTLPLPRYYEVYVVRHGRVLGSCGTFRVEGKQTVRVTLNAPYPLERGDSWIVTRQGADGAEPGTTVLRPVTT